MSQLRGHTHISVALAPPSRASVACLLAAADAIALFQRCVSGLKEDGIIMVSPTVTMLGWSCWLGGWGGGGVGLDGAAHLREPASALSSGDTV
jgi:hypothetical protein